MHTSTHTHSTTRKATADHDAEVSKASSQGAWHLELGVRHLRLSTYVFLALAYQATFDIEWAKELRWQWIAFVFAHNHLLMVVMYGGCCVMACLGKKKDSLYW